MKTRRRVQVSASEQEVLDGVRVRLITEEERERFDRLIETQHYLKDATLVGEHLRYVADYQGRWLAALTWSAAAYHLKDRDQWIGWTEEQRRRRLGWIANNSRFLILEGAHYPNLASRVMRLCLDRLDGDWRDRWAHGLVVVESFVDGQLFRGTCYQACGWIHLGQTDGWGRQREEFYVRHDRPKQLWVRELWPGSRALLRAQTLPPQWQAQEAAVVPHCPYKVKHLKRMVEYFRGMTDWRKWIKDYPYEGLLAVVLCATLCGVVRGQRDLAAFARGLTRAQRRALRFKRDRRTGKYRAPGETTFFRVLKYTKPQELEAALQGCQEHVLGPATEEDDLIAFDGKTLKSSGGIELASGFSVKTGRWWGTEAVSTGSNEIPAVQRLVARTDLTRRTGVLDALNTQVQTAQQIVQDQGGEYVLTVKGNQPGIGETLQQLWEGRQGAFSPSALDV
jgi:hypothetical protein